MDDFALLFQLRLSGLDDFVSIALNAVDSFERICRELGRYTSGVSFAVDERTNGKIYTNVSSSFPPPPAVKKIGRSIFDFFFLYSQPRRLNLDNFVTRAVSVSP